jgi:hypothetical protein
MKNILFLSIMLQAGFVSTAQQKPDTVIVELANSSRLIFTIKDRKDLPILRQYDFQALFTDILNKIDDRPLLTAPDTARAEEKETESVREIVTWDDDETDDDWYSNRSSRYSRRTKHSMNFDLGLNNYLSDGKFPDNNDELYAVRPWGSWYFGINSIQHTHVGGKLYIEWGMGIHWYSFKYERDNILMTKTEDGVVFTEDAQPNVSYVKSKLSASYLNASLIPVLDFGGRGKKARFWDSNGSTFRIGIGPYAAYRIDSHSKLVYTDDNREKDKNNSNFYLNNFRYGIRLQLGIRSTDLFVNYDLSELYSTDKAANPKLNAFSFGLMF